MDNLRSAIEVLFCKTNPEYIIQQFIRWDSADLTKKIPIDRFIDLSETLENGKIKDELEAIYKITECEWSLPPETHYINQNELQNVFYTLVSFTREVLLEVSEKPVCEFSQLLRWRELSYKLGEDILIAAFFASKDIVSNRQRHYFSWQPTISTNNHHLQEVLANGVTDLHFHLFGSSINFELSWLSLMNDILDRKKDFSQLRNSKLPDVNLWFKEESVSLFILCVKACAIRQLLFKILSKEIGGYQGNKEKIDFYIRILASQTEEEICMYVYDLQNENHRLAFLYGKKYGNETADYAIRHTFSDKNYDQDSYHNSILHGERWLLYKMFHVIFLGKDFRATFKPYFYAYLLIKTRLRKELIQLNSYPGFRNFQDYQGRKSIFIKENSIYEKLMVNLAINNCLKGQHVDYLEARISPYNKLEENIDLIKKLDNIVYNKNYSISDGNKIPKTHKFFYTFHFIKSEKNNVDSNSPIQLITPRNPFIRKKVKEQAMAINLLRRQLCDTKERLVGIDAASSEIGYRPEIFAQAFRYLKKYSCELENHFLQSSSLNALGFTYHVGEDFLDIADGLRAIDETIKFLNFRRGDRMGHCLALGVNPKKYYAQKKMGIILSKQDHMDNIVWLLMQIKIYDINCSQSLIFELNQRYRELFDEIYNNEINLHTPYDIYYLSWLLRGDDPMIYLNKNFRKSGAAHPITYWESCGLNRFSEEIRNARKSKEARDLYYQYHFNNEVKKQGKIYHEYKVSKDYIELIRKVQNALMFDISKKQIAIESNPTSNKLIGAYLLYADHPLKRFFNLGLTCNHDEINTCPQISVSLNSDDLGVFATNIENEYALMAIATEKMKKEDGTKIYNSRMIYDWLNRIRIMGFEQRFKK